jgi:hypothetical protein
LQAEQEQAQRIQRDQAAEQALQVLITAQVETVLRLLLLDLL